MSIARRVLRVLRLLDCFDPSFLPLLKDRDSVMTSCPNETFVRVVGSTSLVPVLTSAAAQLATAREYGFPSWRALKAEIDRRRAPNVAAFIRACTAGDIAALRELLSKESSLAREPVASGSTGLHLAVRHPEALRLLLEYGANPNTRETRDNASPLHFAAAHGPLESIRILLDAGADVHGAGDVHQSGVMGWAARKDNRAAVDLLVERGARHHIFSAMALGDRGLVERRVRGGTRLRVTTPLPI
jgi:hypothetical protein